MMRPYFLHLFNEASQSMHSDLHTAVKHAKQNEAVLQKMSQTFSMSAQCIDSGVQSLEELLSFEAGVTRPSRQDCVKRLDMYIVDMVLSYSSVSAMIHTYDPVVECMFKDHYALLPEHVHDVVLFSSGITNSRAFTASSNMINGQQLCYLLQLFITMDNVAVCPEHVNFTSSDPATLKRLAHPEITVGPISV